MKSLLKKIVPVAILEIIRNLRIASRGIDTPISLAAHFVYAEAVQGDYLEFGVFKGGSFIEAIRELEAAENRWGRDNLVNNRAAYDEASINKADKDFHNLNFKEKIRFFALDSFAGLPSLEDSDEGHSRFREGRYNYAENKFIHNILKNCKISNERLITVPGFFNKTLNDDQKKILNLRAASVVMIDCDLYSSTVSVLEFITDLVQDGTILIFDDWYAYKGSPNKGERRASYEWLKKNPQFILSPFAGRGPCQRAFILNIV
jgi:O-methyltransferase